MKKYLIMALFVAAGITVQAQQFGIKGALNFSNLKSENGTWLDASSRAGYQAGIWLRFGSTIHIQPELYVTGKSAKGEVLDRNNARVDFNFTSLDLPVLLGTRVGMGSVALRLQAGPVISFVIDEDNKFSDALADLPRFSEYKKNNFAAAGGVGLDIGKLRADLRYEHGLSNLSKDDQFDQKVNVWTLGVGLRLF